MEIEGNNQNKIMKEMAEHFQKYDKEIDKEINEISLEEVLLKNAIPLQQSLRDPKDKTVDLLVSLSQFIASINIFPEELNKIKKETHDFKDLINTLNPILETHLKILQNKHDQITNALEMLKDKKAINVHDLTMAFGTVLDISLPLLFLNLQVFTTAVENVYHKHFDEIKEYMDDVVNKNMMNNFENSIKEDDEDSDDDKLSLDIDGLGKF